jgi:glucokinase
MILAGDVGGTKSVLGLFEEGENGLTLVRQDRFLNAEFSSFDEVIERFVSESHRPQIMAASFGIAGPVVDNRVDMLNLAWSMDAAEIGERFGIPCVRLLNDLQALAFGMLHLGPDDFHVLSTRQGAALGTGGNIGMIAAGTGLGEAFLYWDGTHYHPMATEGGHTSFAPMDDTQVDLLRYLQGIFGPAVSYERILSGPGLINLYNFLRDTGRGLEPDALRARFTGTDQARVIANAGLADEFPICTAALELFVTIYGAESGNLALKGLTLGGVYVGGGIAPQILAKLTDGKFLQSFRNKGRRSELLSQIPVSIALAGGRAAVLGAAHYARQSEREAVAMAAAPPGGNGVIASNAPGR